MDDRWAGWAAAAGILMIMVGSFRAFTGFIGLFNDQWVVRGFTGYYFIDITAAAWWMLILGIFVVLAGLGVLAGQPGPASSASWPLLWPRSPSSSGCRSTPSGRS